MRATVNLAALVVVVTLIMILVVISSSEASTMYMTDEEKSELRKKSVEMFNHAYNAYMDHAFPADELMPLSCKGRYRGSEPSRGDIDDTLGNFTLTLIDTLDTLAMIGDFDGFDKAVRNVLKEARFDTDAVVSVFETNIRILGGLLGGHVAATYFRRKKLSMFWYKGELLTMAKEVGDRLLPAFNTSTGIPYPRVNLKHGITQKLASSRDTCTSCAGTMILEFAALSRLTGIATYEEKARRAMDYLWAQRHRGSDLMGLVINIHNGDWVRRESGVGAGIDSYYEYVLKAYVLLGDDIYLTRFNKHYEAVMRYISQGPLLVDVHMHKPTSASRNFMDALLAFWPGLQVLVGDIGPAVETHEMLYQVVQRHNFLPEAFTTDFRVHWAHHPLRPEFLESTYFLYKATGDPYYLHVGKKVLENLEEHARVPCGFAAIKDLKRGTHEDQMDSYVLAETFKYLFLLFSNKEDVVMDVDDFLFTTEAHILPLSLSVGNYSWRTPKVRPDIYKFDMMSVAEMTRAAEDDVGVTPEDWTGQQEEDWGVCLNYHITVPEGHGYPHSLRLQLGDLVDRAHPRLHSDRPRLRAVDFVAGNKEHIDMLQQMGIRMATMPDGRIQLLHTASEALSQAYAEAGLEFMQQMIELSKLQQQQQESQHEPMFIRVMTTPSDEVQVLKAGPAQFGYDLQSNPPISGQLAVAEPFKACSTVDNGFDMMGKIVVMERGDCMFVDKARTLQRNGAIGGIVMDTAEGSSSEQLSLFAMSGDGTNDVNIPMVFLFRQQGQDLLNKMQEFPDLVVELSAKDGTASSESDETEGSASSQPATPQREPEGPGISEPPVSATLPSERTEQDDWAPLSKSEHSFYHQDHLDAGSWRYMLQAGTKFFHLVIEFKVRTDPVLEPMLFEVLPDGSKMFTFHLQDRRTEAEKGEKPNLNEMYLDVIHTFQHRTNFEELERSPEYLKAIARFMESAYFHIDRIDLPTLEAIRDFTRTIKIKHIYPDGQSVLYRKSDHVSSEGSDQPLSQHGKEPEDVEVKIFTEIRPRSSSSGVVEETDFSEGHQKVQSPPLHQQQPQAAPEDEQLKQHEQHQQPSEHIQQQQPQSSQQHPQEPSEQQQQQAEQRHLQQPSQQPQSASEERTVSLDSASSSGLPVASLDEDSPNVIGGQDLPSSPSSSSSAASSSSSTQSSSSSTTSSSSSSSKEESQQRRAKDEF